MKKSLRRGILFTVIVIAGSVMILFDVPLLVMIPLILVVGFVILLLLGAMTVADIRSVFTRKKVKDSKKISIIQRLDEMKFFEKKTSTTG
jgi:ABC-type bacteriocin/lantibiotic exporter with double-glycine peptidase domain